MFAWPSARRQAALTHWILRGLIAYAAILCAGPAARAGDGPARTFALKLRAGDVATTPANDLRAALRDGMTVHPDARYIVQFDGPLDPTRKVVLSAAGIHLGDYLPDFAYHLDPRKTAPEALLEIPFVRWIGRYQPTWKIDPAIGQPMSPYQTAQRATLAQQGQLKVTLTLFPDADRAAVESAVAACGASVVTRYRTFSRALYDVVTAPGQLAQLAAIPDVQYLEDAPEVTPRNSDVRWIVQSNQLDVTPLYDQGLTGSGQIVGIIDGEINVDHCAFSDLVPIGPTHRKIVAYNTAIAYDPHGTYVAGTVVGDGGGFDDNRGVAYDGRLTFNTLNAPVTQTRLVQHHLQGARVHTNSWGNDTTNVYDSFARSLDEFGYVFEDSLVLFGVTNLSALRNPDIAKNLLAVGATGNVPDQGTHCLGGTGPTIDGRRKPEIYAPGCNVYTSIGAGVVCDTAPQSGTSIACPAVAGVAMLVRQYFADGFYPTGQAVALDGFSPSAALVKAVLLNSAVDLPAVPDYPSNLEGWGRVRADDALAFAQDARRLSVHDVRHADGLDTGGWYEWPVDVWAGTEKLKITLAWNDPPGTAGASFVSVNDLDLEVRAPDDTLYRGNVFAGGVSTTGGTADAINNVEQVHLLNPAIGRWTVKVTAPAVNVGPQGYALVATGNALAVGPPLRLKLLDDPPATVSPGTPRSLVLRASAGTQLVQDVALHLRFDAGAAFVAYPLTPLVDDLYLATLPAGVCGERIEFFFSADGDGGEVVKLPAGAPGDTFAVEVGAFGTEFADDFESDRGWTVGGSVSDGAWQRAVPADPNRGAPPNDYDGSGKCYVTDNAVGNSDVDGGTTTLTSPPIAVVGGDRIHYAYWVADTIDIPMGPEDALTVEYATDASGSNWQEVRRYDQPLAAWRIETLVVGLDLPKSATLRVRFGASDLSPGDIVEAAVDAFRVERFNCTASGDGDFDGDGDLDLRDFAAFQGCFGTTPPPPACQSGDLNGDGQITLSDHAALVSRLGPPVTTTVAPDKSGGDHTGLIKIDHDDGKLPNLVTE